MTIQNNYFWLLPFISFASGYFFLSMIFAPRHLTTPDVLGKSLHHAVRVLSDLDLNARIMAEKEEIDLPAGTVLSQKPTPGQKIRPHASIFLLVSKKPPLTNAPTLQLKTTKELKTILNKHSIRAKKYYLASSTPTDTCIGQIPEANQPLDEKKNIALYISTGNQQPIIMPNFKNQSMQEVLKKIASYDITPIITHTHMVNNDHQCQTCRVIDQKPLPGSIITENKSTKLHLKVAP